MNYKKKQEKYKEMCNKVISVYDSGKRCNRKGEVRIKGVPFVNEEKRKLKEERKAKQEKRKVTLKNKRETERKNRLWQQ